MKRLSMFLLPACLALLCIGISPSDPPDGVPPPDLKPVVDGNTQFALELYAKLRDGEGNLFFSPYSISSALAIAYAGAGGATEQQMADVMHFPLDQDECHTQMAKIRRALARDGKRRGTELRIANGLWPQKGQPLDRSYLRLVQGKHAASVDYVDYRMGAGRARDRINAWIERNTEHLIKNALGASDVTPDTRLIIANTIYFKGEWARRFEKALTTPGPFWISENESVDTSMMEQKNEFLLADADLLQVLELPYKAHDMSMLVFLPKARGGLAELEAQLTPENLAGWLGGLEWHTVDVRLPKLKMESRLPLRGTLTAMGMADVFAPGAADFSGITRESMFFIMAVQHAAVVEVDEAGTVAAAATTTHGGCAPATVTPPPATFHADHPFVFLIRDNRTGTVLFLGRVVDPRQQD